MTDNQTTELLPCPFCGSEASKRLFYGARYGVYCDECDARVGGLFKTETEAIAAWNTRAMRGTLTADDIRDLIERHSDESGGNGRDFHNGAYEAIADELNAHVGRTCKLEPLSALDVALNMLDQTEWGACSECGCAVPMDARFCNECGKAVSE